MKTREFLIDKGRDDVVGRAEVVVEPEDVARRKELEYKKLKRMVAYATTAACLRATILRYFGDPAAKEPCAACSNCHRRVVLDAGERDEADAVLERALRSWRIGLARRQAVRRRRRTWGSHRRRAAVRAGAESQRAHPRAGDRRGFRE